MADASVVVCVGSRLNQTNFSNPSSGNKLYDALAWRFANAYKQTTTPRIVRFHSVQMHIKIKNQ